MFTLVLTIGVNAAPSTNPADYVFYDTMEYGSANTNYTGGELSYSTDVAYNGTKSLKLTSDGDVTFDQYITNFDYVNTPDGACVDFWVYHEGLSDSPNTETGIFTTKSTWGTQGGFYLYRRLGTGGGITRSTDAAIAPSGYYSMPLYSSLSNAQNALIKWRNFKWCYAVGYAASGNTTVYFYNESGNVYNASTLRSNFGKIYLHNRQADNTSNDIFFDNIRIWNYTKYGATGPLEFVIGSNTTITFGEGTTNTSNTTINTINYNVIITGDITNSTFFVYNTTGLVYNRSIYNNSIQNYNISGEFTVPRDGIYYINATVTNGIIINKTETRTIRIDTQKPIITININSPSINNNSVYANVTNVTFNYTIFDNNLWGYNLTCRNNNSEIEYTRQLTGITNSSYNITLSNAFRVTGVKNCSLQVADSHTDTEFTREIYIEPKKGLENEKLIINNGELEVFYDSDRSTLKLTSVSYEQKQDRISPIFNYEKPTETKEEYIEWGIKFKGRAELVEQSKYKGHIVIVPESGILSDAYWVDAEDYTDNPVETVIDKDQIRYRVNIKDTKALEYKTESIGGLNVETLNFSFRVVNLTSNFTSYNNATIQRYPFTVGFNLSGFLPNATCGIYVNDTSFMSCPNSTTNTVTCSFEKYAFNIPITAYPYCYDEIMVNSSPIRLFNFKHGYLNNINITVFDAISLIKIQNRSINLLVTDSLNNTYYYTFNNGTQNISDLMYGAYTFRFSSVNYTSKYYDVIINEPFIQYMNIYLLSISDSFFTVFTIKDRDTGSIIKDAYVTTYYLSNGTWSAETSTQSDITGKVQISYLQETPYRFMVTKDAYQDYIFTLNPIIYSAYDIYMTPSTTIKNNMSLDGVNILYTPKEFINNENTKFEMYYSAYVNNFTSYGYTITYPGGIVSNSGTEPYGSALTNNITVINASNYDIVRVNYYYVTETTGRRNFTINIPIRTNYTTNTFMSNKDNTYGLGIFERILITTLILLFVLGVATLIGQIIPGFFLALFVAGYLVFIGFIPIWVILPSMLGGFFIMLKSMSGAY